MPIGLRERRIAIAFIGFCTALPVAAAAQDAPESAIVSPDPSSSDPDLRPAIADDGQTPAPTAEDNASIDKALAVDPASYLNMPARPLRLPALAAGKGLDLSRTDRPDGSGTVVVKKPLASEWDANVGADLGYAADTPYGYDPRNPLRATRNAGGAAWASVGLPNFASIDARVDPNNEQGRIGTTFKRSLPVGDKFSVSVQSRYSVTESLGQPQPTASDIPLRIAPPSDPAAPVPRVWGNENIAKFNILPTGTTLGAGLSSTSTDPVTHNTLSAEQKIYGPLGVTTAVTDVGRVNENKSVTARFKLTW